MNKLSFTSRQIKQLNISYLLEDIVSIIKKNFIAPIYIWGSTSSRLVPLRGGSLLFITKFPEVPDILILSQANDDNDDNDSP